MPRLFCDQERMLLSCVPGIQLIGCDETGVTAYAGPLAAAAVEPDPVSLYAPVVVDCKLLDSAELEEAYKDVIIKSKAWAVAYASVAEVDRIGVQRASQLAMRRAVKASVVPTRTVVVLVDYHCIPGIHHLQWPLENGDSIAACISAASIVAKYTRDQLMLELHKKHPDYRWDTNKGCTTTAHKAAIKQFGLTPYHRKTWTNKVLKELESAKADLTESNSGNVLTSSSELLKFNASYITSSSSVSSDPK